MVKAALDSGRPSIVGGAGNCPAIVDELADIQLAVGAIIASKTFDAGQICKWRVGRFLGALTLCLAPLQVPRRTA